jgi:hypothetical protein
MKSTFTKKLIGLVLSLFSLTALAQCPSVTSLGVIYGANGSVSVTPVINGTVSPTQTMYYWQIIPNANQYSTSFQSQGEFQFPANGTYLVCLSFNDSLNGCTSNQYCDSININNMAPTSCSASFLSYSDSNCVTYFVNSSIGNNLTYSWHINGLNYYTTNVNVNLANGSYPVILETFSNGMFCDSTYQLINVSCSGTNTVSCYADFTFYIDSTTCETHITNLSTGNNLTYQWYDMANNDTLLSTAVNPTLSLAGGYPRIGLYTFSNGTFCDSISQYINVSCGGTVTPSPCLANAQFNVFADSVNSGNFYVYDLSSGTGTVSYLWNFGDGTSSSQAYPFHQYAVPGSYIICLTITATSDSLTCSDIHCDSSSVHRMAAGFLMSQIQVVPQSVTGIKQTERVIGLRAFPNPMADELIIEGTAIGSNKLSFALIDALGRITLSGNLTTSKESINTSVLKKGFYTLSVFNEKGISVSTIKLVK